MEGYNLALYKYLIRQQKLVPITSDKKIHSRLYLFAGGTMQRSEPDGGCRCLRHRISRQCRLATHLHNQIRRCQLPQDLHDPCPVHTLRCMHDLQDRLLTPLVLHDLPTEQASCPITYSNNSTSRHWIHHQQPHISPLFQAPGRHVRDHDPRAAQSQPCALHPVLVGIQQGTRWTNPSCSVYHTTWGRWIGRKENDSGAERREKLELATNKKKTGHATEETKEGTMDENVFLVGRKRILRTRTSPIAILLVEITYNQPLFASGFNPKPPHI
jgi:hypothetical protein